MQDEIVHDSSPTADLFIWDCSHFSEASACGDNANMLTRSSCPQGVMFSLSYVNKETSADKN